MSRWLPAFGFIESWIILTKLDIWYNFWLKKGDFCLLFNSIEKLQTSCKRLVKEWWKTDIIPHEVIPFSLKLLEGVARYAGQLLAPADGFDQGFFCPSSKKKSLHLFRMQVCISRRRPGMLHWAMSMRKPLDTNLLRSFLSRPPHPLVWSSCSRNSDFRHVTALT